MNKVDKKKISEWCDANWKINEENFKASQIYCGLITGGALGDPTLALSFGMAVMLGKPVILMVEKETILPKRMKDIADHIEYFDSKDKNSLEKASISMAKKAKEILKSREEKEKIS